MLFRTRLEELLTATYQVLEEAARLYSGASSEEKIYRNESAENRLKTIAAFYFPELKVQVSNVVVLGGKVGATAIRVNDQWRTYKLKRTSVSTAEEREISKEYIETISASSATMQGYYKDLLAAVKTLERNAVPMISQCSVVGSGDRDIATVAHPQTVPAVRRPAHRPRGDRTLHRQEEPLAVSGKSRARPGNGPIHRIGRTRARCVGRAPK